MLQLAHVSHPRLLRRTAIGSELVPYRLSHKRTQRDSPFGRCGLGPAKDGIRDLECGLHAHSLPYLRELVNSCGKKQQDRSWQRSVTKDEIRFNFSLSGQ